MPLSALQSSRFFRVGYHIIFWLVALAGFTYFFGHLAADYKNTFYFVCLLIPIIALSTYVINYWLIPAYLLKKMYFRFFSYFFFTLIISLWAELLLILWALIWLANYRYDQLNPVLSNIYLLAISLYCVVFLISSLKLLQYWYASQQRIQLLREQQLEAALKLKEVELKLLKGQIHPHFLFNTLNNLYGLALEHSAQLPEAILQLANMLDVLLYRSRADAILLEEEIALTENYIALEQLRFGERLNVQYIKPEDAEQLALAPFLLFPLVENAFKHGFSQESASLWLSIELQVVKENLMARIENSIPEKRAVETSDRAEGIGLNNLKKRLKLLYPEQHKLTVELQDKSFIIHLQVPLQQRDE